MTRSVFRNCWVSCPVAGKSQCGGGGLCVLGDSASETIDCWIENCHVYETTAYESWAGGGIRANGTIRNTMITNCSSRLSYGAIGNSPKLFGCTVTKCQSANSVLWRTPLTDTLIQDNAATNGSYVLDASSWCSPSFIGSFFRGNSAVGQVLNCGFDYRQSPACYSNCVFTLNKNTANNGGLYGIGNTPTIEIADCIFVENTPKNRGIFEIGMTTDSSGTMKGLTIRNCFFDSPKSYSSIIYSNQSGTMPIRLENCTLIQGQNTATISLGDTAATVFYAANCLIYSYNRKYTEKTYFATASSMTNCVFTWDNPYDPSSKGDINLDAEYGNSECYYTQVGFRDPANGDYRPKKDSLLLDRSARPAWVTGTTRLTMNKDLGDGTWTEKPAARVTACAGMTGIEKTFDVGVKVTRNNTQPRVVNGKIDVGCFEYRPKQGIVLMAR